tara:strand:+ start:788 stop:1306 length:519 start_codon:yes stop_codon:yes gene_type:complete
MSFQKAHSISNELGEVLVTSGIVTLDGMAATTDLAPSVSASGKRYRVLEIGYTVQALANPGTAGIGDCFDFGVVSDPDAFLNNVPVPTTFVDDPNVPSATYGAGNTISTTRGGAETLSFVAAGTGNVDSDGVPFLEPGEVIRVTRNNNTATAQLDVVFFARLAPVIGRDIFA